MRRATLESVAPSEVYQINIVAISVENTTGNWSTITAETLAALPTTTSSSISSTSTMESVCYSYNVGCIISAL